MVRIKKTYNGIITTRSRVESAPMLDASKVRIKAKRNSATDWKVKNGEEENLGTMNIDFSDGGGIGAREMNWDSNF